MATVGGKAGQTIRRLDGGSGCEGRSEGQKDHKGQMIGNISWWRWVGMGRSEDRKDRKGQNVRRQRWVGGQVRTKIQVGRSDGGNGWLGGQSKIWLGGQSKL